MKIGIITMHKVMNYGSALQAYALQEAIKKIGYSSEFIDYVYPNNPVHRTLIFRIRHWLLNLLTGFPAVRKKNKYEDFYEKYFCCSSQKYFSPSSLHEETFNYDLYLTGSDQVWNPNCVRYDKSFMLDFIPKGKLKIAYAASFTKSTLPSDLLSDYKKYLSQYSTILVRESSALEICKNIVHTKTALVCDPTFLLDASEWNKILVNSRVKIKKPYILLYILRYSYDPYPELEKIFDILQKQTNLHFVFLDGQLKDFKRKNTTVIKSAGPLDFLSLIKNASFVVTTSFHGTAFSLNFGIPFYSVIKSFDYKDTRIIDLLKYVHAEDRAILYNKPLTYYDMKMDYSKIKGYLEEYRKNSLEYLHNSLLLK